MNKNLIIFFVAMLFVVKGSLAFAIGESTVSVTTKASRTVTPDVAYLVVAVETKAKTAKEAMDENSRKMNAVTKSLRICLNKENGDKIETEQLRVTPEYNYKNKETLLVGYNASNTIQIKTKNLNKISEIINLALQNGASNLDSVQFKIDDYSKYSTELTVKSVKLAKQKAEIIAQSLNEQLAKVKTISTYSNFDESVNCMAKMVRAGASFAPSLEIPLFPEEINVETTTNAEFYLK